MAARQATLALLKPDLVASEAHVREVLQLLARQAPALRVAARRRLECSPALAETFYAEHRGKFFFQRLVEGISAGPMEALVLVGPDAIAAWRAAIGPTHPPRARIAAPTSFRALYGLTDTRNSFHGSGTVPCAARRNAEGVLGEGLLKQQGPGARAEIGSERYQARASVGGPHVERPLCLPFLSPFSFLPCPSSPALALPFHCPPFLVAPRSSCLSRRV